MIKKKSWENLVETHSESLLRYISLANSLDEVSWRTPVAEGKWSPMEITEHLRAAYEVLIKEQETGKGLKRRSGFLLRALLRFGALPIIMRNRRLPKGARSPREIRPDNCIEDKVEALRVLVEFGSRFAAMVERNRNDAKAKITHHLFGDLTLENGFEFVTIHLENHTRQLPAKNEQ